MLIHSLMGEQDLLNPGSSRAKHGKTTDIGGVQMLKYRRSRIKSVDLWTQPVQLSFPRRSLNTLVGIWGNHIWDTQKRSKNGG